MISLMAIVCAARSHLDGPSTNQNVEIFWEVPAVWSLATIMRYDSASGAHHAKYDSGFEITQELLPNKWKVMPDKGSAPEPEEPEAESGRRTGPSLVGKRVRVFWPYYSTWKKGIVKQCDVRYGVLGKCTVDLLGSQKGTSEAFNFSDPTLQWRGEFVPDPLRWSLPQLPTFHNAPNFMEVDIDVDIIKRVRRWYERHVQPDMMHEDRLESWNSSAEEEPFSGAQGGVAARREYRWNRQFAGGKFGSDINWISPGDLATHQRMSSLYHMLAVGSHVNRYLDLTPNNTARELRVYIPSFVVRSTVRKSFHHHDWDERGGSNGLTMMTPLYDMSNVTEGCNLMYKGAEQKEHMYKYTLGKAAVFGGGTFHASQLCEPRSQLERDRPWAFLCFNFGTDKMEYWPTLHKNIACSGKLIIQPDGKVAPEASCKSYNAALKEDAEDGTKPETEAQTETEVATATAGPDESEGEREEL